MSRDPQLRLQDIIEACEKIAQYTDGYDADAFGRDSKTQDAVIRQFEIASEAIKGLPHEVTSLESSIP